MPSFPRPAAARAAALSSLLEALDAAGIAARVKSLGGPSPHPTTSVTGVTFDSRGVEPGDLYAALPGANVHGARFVADAAARGARAILTDETGAELARAAADDGQPLPVVVVDDPRAALGVVAGAVYADPARRADLCLLGITGTNGKTTTAFLLDAALRALGSTTGLIGTVETRVAGETIRSERTTPEASDLQALLATMVERGVDVCSMEVSSHAMVLHRVAGVVFDVVGFTNLSQDHLDFHPTMNDYFAAKASLFTPGHARRGVVVVDDAWGARLARESGVPVVTICSTGPADYQVERDLRDAQAFRLVHAGRSHTGRSPLPGDFNVLNTALAAVMIAEAGIAGLDEALAAVTADPSVPGRMELVRVRDDQPLAVVDFAHTPDAVRAALAALRPQVRGRLVAVLGAGGDRDPGKRPAMGAAGAAAADLLVVTDDNPRSEDPATIRSAVLAGVPGDLAARVVEVAGRRAAIRRAVEGLGPDDAVVLLGKGHETGQDVGGVVHPFDDRDELARALAEQPGDPGVATTAATPRTRETAETDGAAR